MTKGGTHSGDEETEATELAQVTQPVSGRVSTQI